MKRIVLLLAAALVAGCMSPPLVVGELPIVGGVPVAGGIPIEAIQVLPPPARYAAAALALEAAGRIDYVYVSRADAQRICRGSGACAHRRLGGSCRITVADDYAPDFLAATLEHERAHCAGWPANHPL